jgi:hypothetical protein
MGKGKHGLISDLNDNGAWNSSYSSVFGCVNGEGKGDYTV